MTIQEVLSTVDCLKLNAIDEGQKLNWLNDIEAMIYTEIVLPRKDSENVTKVEINIECDYNDVLIAPEPYSKLYAEYVMSKIDFVNREWVSYNNQIDAFNQSYKEFSAYYARMHPHKKVKLKNFM